MERGLASRGGSLPRGAPPYQCSDRICAPCSASHHERRKATQPRRSFEVRSGVEEHLDHLRGVLDLKDTIARLQAYEAAGAQVLYAPGLTDLDQIREVVDSVEAPVNVLCMPGGPNVADLASAGVARISVGSAFYSVTMNALATAGREWREQGTHDFWKAAIGGIAATTPAFEDS